MPKHYTDFAAARGVTLLSEGDCQFCGASAACDCETGLYVSKVPKVGVVYAVTFKHAITRRCLVHTPDNTLGHAKCDPNDGRQWWTSTPVGKKGFQIKNLKSSQCMFMNAKKLGTYKCLDRANGQVWRVME